MGETRRVDLDAIEGRERAATPGPWSSPSRLRDRGHDDVWSHGTAKVTAVVTCRDGVMRWNRDEDRLFVVWAREDIPALCERVRALERENAEHLYARSRSAKALDRIYAAALDARNPPAVPIGQEPADVYPDAVIARVRALESALREAIEGHGGLCDYYETESDGLTPSSNELTSALLVRLRAVLGGET